MKIRFRCFGVWLLLSLFSLLAVAQDAPSPEAAKQEAPKPVDPLDMNPVLKLIARINGLAAEMARLEARYPKAKEEQQAALADLNAVTIELQKKYKAPPGWVFNDDGKWRPNPNAAPDPSGVPQPQQTDPNP